MDENYTRSKSLNIAALPADRIELKGKLFLFDIEGRLEESLDFLNTQYKNKELFYEACEFVNYNMTEAVRATFNQLEVIGYYPSTEAEMELDLSIKHALVGSYKAAFADLRRALELTVLGIFLTSKYADQKKASDWLKSQTNTPYMNEMLTKLSASDRFSELNKKVDWKKNIQSFYWKISDFAHNKGYSNGYRELNDLSFFTSGSHIPNVKTSTLNLFLDCYIEAVAEIVTLYSLYNPLILVGLPLDEKFGLNGLASGFYYDGQSELVFKLLPKQYLTFFENLSKTDEEIIGIQQWVNDMPDLTAEDIKNQAEQQNQFFFNLNKGKQTDV